ncbi:MAG: hypothetical protein JST86_01730 [Bacteroidetes bacterium]|nr:hypothetical protein [Bacteroidota bacterium]
MTRIRPDVDIIMDVLKATLEAQPHSTFAASLLRQYQERGSLSKKQLEGLYNKAEKIKDLPPAKLATLQAIILRKHTRHRSALPVNQPLFTKDEEAGKMIAAILEKYPQHKRVLFLKTQYDHNKPFSTIETTELKRFFKLLIEK